jgi:hypothetical protein
LGAFYAAVRRRGVLGELLGVATELFGEFLGEGEKVLEQDAGGVEPGGDACHMGQRAQRAAESQSIQTTQDP